MVMLTDVLQALAAIFALAAIVLIAFSIWRGAWHLIPILAVLLIVNVGLFIVQGNLR